MMFRLNLCRRFVSLPHKKPFLSKDNNQDLRQLFECKTESEIPPLLQSQGTQLDATFCAAAVEQLGKLKQQHGGPTNKDVLSSIYTLSKPLSFQPRELSRFVYPLAFHRLDSQLPVFMEEKLNDLPDYRDFSGHELSNVAWTLVNFKSRNSLFFERLNFELESRNPSRLDANALSCFMWSFAVLKHQPSARVVEKFILAASKELDQFSLQSLVNLIWAFAKFGVKTSVLNEKEAGMVKNMFAQVRGRGLKKLRVQSLANLLWSQAKITPGENVDAELTERILVVLRKTKPESFNPMAIRNILWSVAILGLPLDAELLKALSKASVVVGVADNIAEEENDLEFALNTLGLEIRGGRTLALK